MVVFYTLAYSWTIRMTVLFVFLVGEQSILKLLELVDTHIPEPTRDLDKSFYFPVEHVYSITGERTVYIISYNLLRKMFLVCNANNSRLPLLGMFIQVEALYVLVK